MSSSTRGSINLLVQSCFVFLCFEICYAEDTLTPGNELKDGDFLESPNKWFRLRFFDLGYGVSERYLGVEYTESYGEMKVVWVANRESPFNDTTGFLNIAGDGDLVLNDGYGTSININSERPAMSSSNSTTSATLVDSGNFILEAGEEIVWQSFDYPTDTILPGMKFGLFGLKQGQLRYAFFTSWMSPGVPAPGAFTLGVDPNNTNQLAIWRRGLVYWRSGDWNGKVFSNMPDVILEYYAKYFQFKYILNENECYFSYSLVNDSWSSWIEVNSSGEVRLFVDMRAGTGRTLQPLSSCDAQEKDKLKGCIEQKPSNCSGGDKFIITTGRMRNWGIIQDNSSLGLSDCKEICKNDCFCKAYKSAQSNGTGCLFSGDQKGDHLDSGNQTEIFYFRQGKARRGICWGLANQGTEVFIHELGTRIAAIHGISGTNKLKLKGQQDYELPLFRFSTIENATSHFSNANKLGQGGFGPVYKGNLADGQEIAVKRLSKGSGQGVEEFKNEVMLISNLQHRNLVRVLGCCIEGEEKILVYEYLPNNSLDSFLFDETKRALLDWKKRIDIIEGIAQGLLYLHKYSRLKIIHRDMKNSNVLLDSKMNPKISDFGTAKIFGENESRANTNRIIGTYGYMPPEYAINGLFSEKSDVFSFGVMMLEILSGKKNTAFHPSNGCSNLLEYAWNLWREERSLELMDPTVAETCTATAKFSQCVQVALLCVQEGATDRPTMSEVVPMLGGEMVNLPHPKQPAFSNLAREGDNNNLPENPASSVNDASNSGIQAR
ncbi:hypothetical protein FNV43_RR04096 [Rhamnella rubrinervis]|uniref:Receptor-like serine/threonine-protein kinase n=1 Tax=Rhamnella rubrinervis TaxID=2594499 RepID=A0A8K0HJP6_9ROSA|nr:hypothetical protein FNV43_RR04096 [Rhamnella rubrinervis]